MRRFFAAVVAVCAMVAFNAPGALAGGPVDRPLTCKGTSTIEFDLATSTLTTTSESTCSHLGRLSGQVTITFDLTSSSSTYTDEVEAANGDLLYLSAVSHTFFVSPTEFVTISPRTFTGGTGRFEDATGSALFTSTGIQSPDDPFIFHETWTIVGTISY